METTLNKSKPVKVKRGKEPTLLERCEAYLREQFPVKDGQILRVVHLWAKNFRIKVYKSQKGATSVMTFDKLVSSKFVQVREKEDGTLVHKVFS